MCLLLSFLFALGLCWGSSLNRNRHTVGNYKQEFLLDNSHTRKVPTQDSQPSVSKRTTETHCRRLIHPHSTALKTESSILSFSRIQSSHIMSKFSLVRSKSEGSKTRDSWIFWLFAVIYDNKPHHALIQIHKLCFNRWLAGLYSSRSKSSTPPEHIPAYSGMSQSRSGADSELWNPQETSRHWFTSVLLNGWSLRTHIFSLIVKPPPNFIR